MYYFFGCSYCKDDGLQHGHNHFITCEFLFERKVSRMKEVTEKLNVLLTPNEIYEGICRGINNNNYNTTTKEEKRNTNNSNHSQEIIGW